MAALTRSKCDTAHVASICPARRTIAGRALFTAFTALSGCAVDDRLLLQSDGGGAGGSTVGRAGAGPNQGNTAGNGVAGKGSADSPTEGGSSGEGGGPSLVLPGCPDLDGSGVSDCEETIVENASFSNGYLPWTPEADILLGWRPEDASAAEQPGLVTLTSARVLNSDSLATAGVSQCVTVNEIGAFVFSAHLFIPREQGGGSASLGALFFATENCSDAAIGAFMAPVLATVGEWVVSAADAQVPFGTRSISVRLLTIKPFRQKSLEVLFDDVLVRKR